MVASAPRERGEGADRLGPHRRVLVRDQALDRGARGDQLERAQHLERPPPHLGALVMEEERRDQVRAPLGHQQIDGVEHLLRVAAPERGHQRIERGRVGGVEPLVGIDAMLEQAFAERGHVVAARAIGHAEPEHDQTPGRSS